MIALAEAQARILALVKPLPATQVPLTEASGRWLADDVRARRTQPARDLSAMDGYAVRAGDGPDWRLIGESAAGRPFEGTAGRGEAVRIFTGAAMPAGTDAVLIQENVARTGDVIRQVAGDAPVTQRNVRLRGGDFSEGDLLLAAGTRLAPPQIALAATGGWGSVTVGGRPRVAILATGDELVPAGTDAGADRLPESNATMVAAMLSALGAQTNLLGIAPDRLEAIRTLIESAEADIIVTIGGASVGDHDLVRPALEAAGARLDFWKIAMRPGKPFMAGTLGPAVIAGLPGNPVSAYVTARLLVEPVVRAMQGDRFPLPVREPARLGASMPANGTRTDHVRGLFGSEGVMPLGINDSAALSALARSDLLIVREPDAGPAQPGDAVEIIRLS